MGQLTAVIIFTVTQADGEVRHKPPPRLAHTLLQPQEDCGQTVTGLAQFPQI